jgi:hypothetical protein
MRHPLPPRPFLDTIAMRVALVWSLLRVAAAVGSAGMEVPFPEALTGSLTTVPLIVVLVIFAVCIEMGRRAELVFLANLGYSFSHIAALIAVQCLVFEAVLRLAVV